MRKILPFALALSIILSSCDGLGYGKYGRCKATTKAGTRCKSNAGKTAIVGHTGYRARIF